MIFRFFRQVRAGWQDLSSLGTPSTPVAIGLISLATTGLLLGVKQLGWLQARELAAFDQMVRVRQEQKLDPRLLIVTITEEDIRRWQQWPLSDQTVAQVLAQLERHNPQVIGLDLYRDLPQEPGHQALATQLQSPKTIVITEIGSSDSGSIPPPPQVPEDRVGFNDLLVDSDGVVRRNLLFAASREGDTLFSFSLRLALAYLAAQGVTPQLTATNEMQLGQTLLPLLQKNSGGYQTIDAEGYQILLRYRSAQPIARTVTLTQVLAGQVADDWVHNKIILIGTTAPSAKDLFYTPYSPSAKDNPKMPGVFIHAQMVSQIIGAVLDNQPLFWFWPEWAEAVWIGAWAFAGGVLAWYIRHPLLLSVSGAGVLAILVGSCFGLFLSHGWVPLVAPAVSLIMAGGAAVAYRAYQAHHQNKIVMRLLGQNTSPEIAEALWASRDRLIKSGRLPGQKLTATVLFTDLRNFSTISERMPPEVLFDWLNEYLEVMTQQVQTHRGIINKFTGDGMMAVFGVPVPHTTPLSIAEDANHAVACALAMGDRLIELNQQWQQRDLPFVEMRVGIFTGPVVVGSLGGKDRLEYGVIGDSVNIASRLESCEKERQPTPCRVLIAQETLAHIQAQFKVEAWGPLALKGKQQLVDVYRVVGLISNSSEINLPDLEVPQKPLQINPGQLEEATS